MASKFIKGLTEKLTMLVDDWFVIQPDAEEDVAYRIKRSNVPDLTDINAWYVSTDGSDSNVGNQKQPFLTIQKAIDAALANDSIVFLDQTNSYNEDVTISSAKPSITFRGLIPNANAGANTELKGTWKLQTGTIYFVNISLNVIWDRVTEFTLRATHCKFSGLYSARLANVVMSDCSWGPNPTTNLASLIIYDTQILLETTINIGKYFQAYGSDIGGNIISGIDTTSNVILKNSTITGDLTITGNLNQENSSTKGTQTVSGTITGVNQRPYEVIKIPLGAAATDHTTGTIDTGIHIDYNFTFIGLPTLEFNPIITDGGPTGTSFIVDINVSDIDGSNTATILSTKLSVDAGGFHSSTAATPAVLSSNTIAQYKFISIDIDQIGGTLAGKGGYVTLNGYRT